MYDMINEGLKKAGACKRGIYRLLLVVTLCTNYAVGTFDLWTNVYTKDQGTRFREDGAREDFISTYTRMKTAALARTRQGMSCEGKSHY